MVEIKWLVISYLIVVVQLGLQAFVFEKDETKRNNRFHNFATLVVYGPAILLFAYLWQVAFNAIG